MLSPLYPWWGTSRLSTGFNGFFVNGFLTGFGMFRKFGGQTALTLCYRASRESAGSVHKTPLFAPFSHSHPFCGLHQG